MKESKTPQLKSRNYFIRTYLNEDQVNNLIKLFNVQHYAYILHDKDDKAPHYHLVLRLNTPTTYSAVEKKVKGISAGADNGKDVNYHIDMDCNIQASYRYLTHEDHADKYHYSPNAIVTDDVGYFRGSYSSTDGNEQENVAYQILSCLQEKMSMRDMAKRFGREYIINRKAYNEYYRDMMEEEETTIKLKNTQATLTLANNNDYTGFAQHVQLNTIHGKAIDLLAYSNRLNANRLQAELDEKGRILYAVAEKMGVDVEELQQIAFYEIEKGE